MRLVTFLLAAVLKLVGGWWLDKRSREEQAHDALEKTREEAAAYAAPPRPKCTLLRVLRKHAD